MGSTIAAEISPWTAPDSTFAMATSQIGHGAWTRSSISRVKPNSWAMLQGDGLDALEHDRDADDARNEHGRERRLGRPGRSPPPMPWPIFGKT